MLASAILSKTSYHAALVCLSPRLRLFSILRKQAQPDFHVS